jgi:hypothetical protein
MLQGKEVGTLVGFGAWNSLSEASFGTTFVGTLYNYFGRKNSGNCKI